MRARLRPLLPHAVMLVAAILLYWAAMRIDVQTGASGRIGPDVWPKAIIVIMGLLCAYELAKRLFAGAPSEARGIVDALSKSPAEAAPAPAHNRKLAGGIALVAAYVALVSWLGFFLTTALFLAIFPWVGGLRRPVLSAVLGVAGSLVLVVVFMRIAYISLPLGEGPFRTLSLALLRALGVS